MKDFLDWFVGHTASNAFYEVWQWLWGATKSPVQPQASPTTTARFFSDRFGAVSV